MKKFILITALAGIALIAGAVDYQITVPATTSYKIAPARNRAPTGTWTTSTAVLQGDMVINAGNWYMAIHAGTTGTTAPVHMSGIVSDDTVLWLFVDKKARTQIAVTQEADAEIWYHDSVAVASGGVFAYLKGQVYYDESSSAVYVYSDTEVNLNIKDR